MTRLAVTVRTHRQWLFLLLVTFSLFPLLASFLHLRWLTFVPWLVVVLGLQALVLYWRNMQQGQLEVNATDVLLNGQVLLSRRSIRSAFAASTPERHVVRVGTRLRSFDVETETATDARLLLEALGFDRTRRAARFTLRLGTPTDVRRQQKRQIVGMLAIGLGAGIAGFFGTLDGSPIALAVDGLLGLGLCVALLLTSLRPLVALTIGTDGLHLRQKLGPSRFIRFDGIERVELQETSMTILLKDGSPVHLSAGTGYEPSKLRRLVEEQVHAAAVQIAEAKRASEGTSSKAAVLVARNGRETSEWMRALAASHDGATGYRVAALPPDTLWQIVDDPQASASARAGAAFALRARLDDEGKRRLRVASETCAAPTLRVALSAVADGPDGDLEEALAHVDDEAASKHRARRLSS